MPPPGANKVHDFALAAMQGLVSNEKIYNALVLKAGREGIDPETQLAITAYLIAEAMMTEGATH